MFEQEANQVVKEILKKQEEELTTLEKALMCNEKLLSSEPSLKGLHTKQQYMEFLRNVAR